MSLYVRVNNNFYTHRKTAKLRSLIGNDALWLPPRWWAYAAENQPDGIFKNYSAAELAQLLGYQGDADKMLQALLQAGFADNKPLRIHDWHEYNGYHASFAERAKKAATVRWQKESSKEKGQERTGEEKRQAMLGASSPPVSATHGSKGELWKLLADEKRLTDSIKYQKGLQKPDQELIGALGKELRAVRAQMKGTATATANSDDTPKQPDQRIDRSIGTSNEGVASQYAEYGEKLAAKFRADCEAAIEEEEQAIEQTRGESAATKQLLRKLGL